MMGALPGVVGRGFAFDHALHPLDHVAARRHRERDEPGHPEGPHSRLARRTHDSLHG